MKEKLNVHSEHRNRLKNRFLQQGLDGLEEHTILELMLFFSIPRRDTNEIAHNLIDKFGSIKGVLEASPEALSEVKHISTNSITYLKLLKEVFKKYYEQKNEDKNQTFNDINKVAKYISTKYFGEQKERVSILCLNSKDELICFEFIGDGDFNSVNMHYRKILEIALKHNVAKIVLAHNHLDSSLEPSNADICVTVELQKILNQINVELVEHIIISNDRFVLVMENNYI